MHPSGVNVGSNVGMAAREEVGVDVHVGNAAGVGAGGFTSVRVGG